MYLLLPPVETGTDPSPAPSGIQKRRENPYRNYRFLTDGSQILEMNQSGLRYIPYGWPLRPRILQAHRQNLHQNCHRLHLRQIHRQRIHPQIPLRQIRNLLNHHLPILHLPKNQILHPALHPLPHLPRRFLLPHRLLPER